MPDLQGDCRGLWEPQHGMFGVSWGVHPSPRTARRHQKVGGGNHHLHQEHPRGAKSIPGQPSLRLGAASPASQGRPGPQPGWILYRHGTGTGDCEHLSRTAGSPLLLHPCSCSRCVPLPCTRVSSCPCGRGDSSIACSHLQRAGDTGASPPHQNLELEGHPAAPCHAESRKERARGMENYQKRVFFFFLIVNLFTTNIVKEFPNKTHKNFSW